MSALSPLLCLFALSLAVYASYLWTFLASRQEMGPLEGVAMGYLTSIHLMGSLATLVPGHGDSFRLTMVLLGLCLTLAWALLLPRLLGPAYARAVLRGRTGRRSR